MSKKLLNQISKFLEEKISSKDVSSKGKKKYHSSLLEAQSIFNNILKEKYHDSKSEIALLKSLKIGYAQAMKSEGKSSEDLKKKFVYKTVKNYVYMGLGYPIRLKNIEMVLIRGAECPKIDVMAVSVSEAKKLLKCSKITGNQLKFIRSFLGMNRVIFSTLIGFDDFEGIIELENRGHQIIKLSSSQRSELNHLIKMAIAEKLMD